MNFSPDDLESKKRTWLLVLLFMWILVLFSLVCVLGHFIVMYILCVLSFWNMCSVLLLAGPAYWSSRDHVHGSGTVGTFGVYRLGRRNPVTSKVRELAEFSRSLSKLLFRLELLFCIFIVLLFSYISDHSRFPSSTFSLLVYRPIIFCFCPGISFCMPYDVNIFS